MSSCIDMVIEIIQSVCAIILVIFGGVLIWSGGFPPTLQTLSHTTTTTGFTLLGIGIAIASFAISGKNQREILEILKGQKPK